LQRNIEGFTLLCRYEKLPRELGVCNQQVIGSSPIAGSSLKAQTRSTYAIERAEWMKGSDRSLPLIAIIRLGNGCSRRCAEGAARSVGMLAMKGEA